MKTLDPGVVAQSVAQNAPKSEPTSEVDALRAALEQRLWQLLLAVPDIRLEGLAGIPDMAAVSGAHATSSAEMTTSGHTREREERETDGSSALASAAHLLAMTIPELGLTRYAETTSQPTAATRDQNWTVQLGHVDADGGSAAVNVLHPLLGDIALDVELSQGAVKVIATVPTDYGARILQEGQQVLAERLLRQGVTLEVLDVMVRRKRKGKDSQPARKRPRKEDR